MKSISIPTVVIRPRIKYDVDNPQDCFHQDALWTLAIRYQLSTFFALDLDRIHHLPHTLLPEKDTYCQAEGNQ